MKIENHRLYNDDNTPANFVESPNVGGSLDAKFLVIHYTAGSSASGAVSHLTKPNGKASAHLVIGRDGEVTQLVPFDRVAWHAGESSWQGLSGLNNYSIGIELDNAGKLTKDEQGNWRAWFNRAYPAEEVMVATHKNQTDSAGWHTFSEAQLERVFEITQLLVETYDLEAVLGHDDIAPTRKVDPGPAFPMSSLQGRLLGRSDNTVALAGTVRTIPSQFVQAQNGQFVVNNALFKFVGFNIRGLVHYGGAYDRGQTFLKHTNDNHRIEQLVKAFELGARVIRVFLPHQNINKEQIGDRLEALLEIISQPPFNNQVYLLPALTDFYGYGHVPFKIGGDVAAGYYQQHPGHIILTKDFFVDGYKNNYLPFARYIVSRFKNEANIFAWEIMNEGKVDNEPDLFIDFNHDVARTIKSIDSNHMVTTGMISCAHAYMGRRDQERVRHRLYERPESSRPIIDFVTVHYPEECHPNAGNPFLGCNKDDITLAHNLGMPVIIEEIMVHGQDRDKLFREDMDKWFAQGANGYMVWGFDALAIGDGESGGVGHPNNDWDPVAKTFTDYTQNHLSRWI